MPVATLVEMLRIFAKDDAMLPVAITFEGGVEARVDDEGQWYVQPARDYRVFLDPSEVTTRFGLRPIELHWRFNNRIVQDQNKHIDTLLLHPSGGWISKQDIMQPVSGNESLHLCTRNLLYIVQSAVYHLKRMASAYVDTCQVQTDFSRQHPESPSANAMVRSGYVDPYFEFEALITAARRTYESLCPAVLRLYGAPKGNETRKFEVALAACTALPTPLEERLSASWSLFGKTIKQYRDCALHYAPIIWANAVLMRRLDGDLWSAQVRIPDNPECNSPNRFTYDRGLDALTYGWEVTAEIVDITVYVMAPYQRAC